MTQRQSQVNLLSINKFAKLARTTPRTLRFYEEKGLFKPAKINSNNGYRLYDPMQARSFLKLKLLNNFQIPLSKIKSLKDKKLLHEPLTQKLALIKNEILEKELEYKFLQEINYFLSEKADLNKVFKRTNFGSYNLLCIKIDKAQYHKISEYLDFLWDTAIKLKINCVPSEITFYLDFLNYNPTSTKLEIGIICSGKVNKKITLPPDFFFRKYPKTTVLLYKYSGPYTYLSLIYQRIRLFIEQEDIKLAGPVFENYIFGVRNSDSPYKYLTLIGIPIV